MTIYGDMMSRSRKKNPIHGIACCKSERWSKRFWHRRMRQRIRMLMRRNIEAEVWPHVREVSNVYLMQKDGKVWVHKEFIGRPNEAKGLRK